MIFDLFGSVRHGVKYFAKLILEYSTNTLKFSQVQVHASRVKYKYFQKYLSTSTNVLCPMPDLSTMHRICMPAGEIV